MEELLAEGYNSRRVEKSQLEIWGFQSHSQTLRTPKGCVQESEILNQVCF